MSLSKPVTIAALNASECALLAFGFILVAGLIGESKSKRKLFELLVILGVSGELIADGGIFLFSRSLQTLEGYEIARLTQEAANANERSKQLLRELARVDLSLRRRGARGPLLIAANIGDNQEIKRFRGQRVSILSCPGKYNQEETENAAVALWIELRSVWAATNNDLPHCGSIGEGLLISVSPKASSKTREAAKALALVISDALLLDVSLPVMVIPAEAKLPPEPADPDTIVVLVPRPFLQ